MPDVLRALRRLPVVALTEGVATMRTALWPLARLDPMPAPPRSTRRPVVLVHGYLGHPDMWRPLMRVLYASGFGEVARVRYASTQSDLHAIVAHIDAVVRPLAWDGSVDLVGHSLGAVACRAWIKELGGARYVRRFVSLGGPHAGTAAWRLTPPRIREILDPDGPWVERLNRGPEPVPTIVIRSRYDHQVLPPIRASLRGAREVILESYGHNGLLWSPEAHHAVITALSEPSAAQPSSA